MTLVSCLKADTWKVNYPRTSLTGLLSKRRQSHLKRDLTIRKEAYTHEKKAMSDIEKKTFSDLWADIWKENYQRTSLTGLLSKRRQSHLKRDLTIRKEVYNYEKRPISGIWADMHSNTEENVHVCHKCCSFVCIHPKRPVCIIIDIQKRHTKETYVH